MVKEIALEQVIRLLSLPAIKKWPHRVWDTSPLQHAYISLFFFTPGHHDYQTPHEQDEIYIVSRGKGQLMAQDNTHDFREGDVLFVQAGDQHHFENFSEDLLL